MKSAEETLKEKLEELRQSFLDKLPERFGEMEDHLSVWRTNGLPQSLADFHRAVHSLSGAGATFGSDELSRRARVLEQYLKTLMDQGAHAEDAVVAEIERLLADVKGSV